jgi:hypothetical protein
LVDSKGDDLLATRKADKKKVGMYFTTPLYEFAMNCGGSARADGRWDRVGHALRFGQLSVLWDSRANWPSNPLFDRSAALRSEAFESRFLRQKAP